MQVLGSAKKQVLGSAKVQFKHEKEYYRAHADLQSVFCAHMAVGVFATCA